MASTQLNLDELEARKVLLEKRIASYRASLSTLSGQCSKSSLHRLIDECEMALEEVRTKLGEI
jgi:hypothetical protein